MEGKTMLIFTTVTGNEFAQKSRFFLIWQIIKFMKFVCFEFVVIPPIHRLKPYVFFSDQKI